MPSGRLVAVVGLLAAGTAGLLAATQPWATVSLVDGRELTTSGQQLAGGMSILALVCVAIALVLPIAGRVWRAVLGVIAIAVGALLLVQVQSAMGAVGPALDALVAEATGLAGSAQAAERATQTATGWPIAGHAAGALALLAGAWTLVTGRRWPVRAQRAARFERSGSGLAWDVMDDGDDPTR